jgi:hypothetical protein
VTGAELLRLRASLSRTSAAKWSGQWVSVMAGRVVACPDPTAPGYENAPGIDVAWQVGREDADAICALHNSAPTLLTAAEPTVLLGEVRERTGDTLCTVAVSKGFDNIPTEWAVIDGDGRRLSERCPTELEALRDALRRLTEPG